MCFTDMHPRGGGGGAGAHCTPDDTQVHPLRNIFVQVYAVLSRTVPCYVVLCCAVPCCATV